MALPKMILFDYGDTLLEEDSFDSLAGTEAVLKSCFSNPKGVTAEEIVRFTSELYADIVKQGISHAPQSQIELHHHVFQRYLYEYFGLKFLVSPVEVEKIFWQHALPIRPSKGIEQLLLFLKEHHIHTGVISNLSFSSEALTYFINLHIPSNAFEFILTSSDYIFKKPHPRIFEIALRKAGLGPDEVFYCGDNVINDIEGAYNCGITPVWYTKYSNYSNMEPNCPHIKIDDWAQFIAYLESIM